MPSLNSIVSKPAMLLGTISSEIIRTAACPACCGCVALLVSIPLSLSSGPKMTKGCPPSSTLVLIPL